MNGWFGKDFYRKGNSVKSSPPAGLRKVKSCCPHPLPENQLILGGFKKLGVISPCLNSETTTFSQF